jgi:4a-hydroxytetrahydrobiopterin dehydratase
MKYRLLPSTNRAPLTSRKCSGEPGRLDLKTIRSLAKGISAKWKIKGKQQLERGFKFPDFKKAWNITNKVGKVAEQQQHHPEIFLSYGEVRLNLSTHQAGGLSDNDFIMAAKIDQLG